LDEERFAAPFLAGAFFAGVFPIRGALARGVFTVRLVDFFAGDFLEVVLVGMGHEPVQRQGQP
jgi:hypothetical protein